MRRFVCPAPTDVKLLISHVALAMHKATGSVMCCMPVWMRIFLDRLAGGVDAGRVNVVPFCGGSLIPGGYVAEPETRPLEVDRALPTLQSPEKQAAGQDCK